jgi:hypothetical protein
MNVKCVNCGKSMRASTGIFQICNRCSNAGRLLTNILQKGVELKYADGTKETVRIK